MHKVVADSAAMGAAVHLRHRDDVDGLRAVAVLAILAFHLDLTGFTGGYVGVDVFFVISGYVILRGILPDLESGRFSLADFYIRRIRRILPALLVVLAATLTAGFIMLSPAEIEELAGSALATTAFGANFFFHDRIHYFANFAYMRPLLHMWSLGIEEQFYIIVPLAIAGLMRLRGVGPGRVLAVLAIASLGYSLIAPAAVSEKHAFYMPMARFWEIAIGGCVAVAERRWRLLRTGSGPVAALGLLAIAASVVLLDSKSGGHQWVVVAVLGAAGVIIGNAQNRGLAAALLASRPAVAVGRISFSVYLVHWPLIVFWQLCVLRPLLPYEQVVIAILTLSAAALLYAAVETPMRARGGWVGNRSALAGIGAAAAVVAVASIVAARDGGAAWRMQEPAREASALFRTAMAERSPCVRDVRWTEIQVCRWNRHAGTHFAILGDSHAHALWSELAQAFGDTSGGIAVLKPRCPPIHGVDILGAKEGCEEFVKGAMEVIESERPKIVILASRWAVVASAVHAPGSRHKSGHLLDLENERARIELSDALTRTVERMRAWGTRVVVVGPVPEIDYHVPSALVRSLHGIGSLPPTRRSAFDLRQRQVMAALAKIGSLEGVIVVYPHTIFCDTETCAVADGLRAFYRDHDHLSPFGAARVSALISSAIDRSGWRLPESALPLPAVRGE
jgi:peptidoglycan/LPS O-acetylase OafA/YrhL